MMAKFSEVLTIVNGRNQKQVVCDDGKYPIYGSGGIMGYANDYICKAETVVIGRKGSINKPIFVETPFWNVDTAFGLCANSEKLNPKYLYYFCEKFDFEKLNTTVTIPSLTKSNLLNVEIPLPNLEKQKQIVELLDKVTSLIFLRKQQLAKLDELVKVRFVEMFENSLWPNTSLNDICSEIVDCPHSTPKYEGNLEHPAIRTTEIKKGYIDWDSMKYVSEEEYQKRIKSLKPVPGDIVYGREGTYGNAAIIPDGYEFCLGQRVMLFRPNKTKCISAYVLYAILSDHVKRQADEKNVGATVPHVNVADAKQFDVVLPPLSIQNQFAAFVERVDQQKQTVQQSLEKLELMKKALMQEYFG